MSSPASHKRKKPVPPVAEDGMCLVCGSERPKLAVVHGDPFCKNNCARRYYGTMPQEEAAKQDDQFATTPRQHQRPTMS